MAQYQSFPDASGDSRTLDKLKALLLPDLSGKAFLDVGCNEGFFCGFAAFEGAARVVGLDASKAFIDRARARFPGCEFIHQGWEQLPDGRFDVILLASALHYADDQPALIRSLVDRLTDTGVLVLELGVVPSADAEWRRVVRGIDERLFPTMPMLREVLGSMAWKWMGPSIGQDGDPVPRHVLHVSRKRPVAYLLMQPPGYGKSSLAGGLFPSAGIQVVSGDKALASLAKASIGVSKELHALVSRDYSPFHLDQLIQKIFDQGLAPDLVDLWRSGIPAGTDFALDAFVPNDQHHVVEAWLERAGYMPVTLSWERIGQPPLSSDVTVSRAESFYLAMRNGSEAFPVRASPVRTDPAGFVDNIELADGVLRLRGWAVDDKGEFPDCLEVRLCKKTHLIRRFSRETRPDVQRHLALGHALFGYNLVLDVPGIENVTALAADFRVSIPIGRGKPLRLSQSVQLALKGQDRLRARS